MCLKYPDKGKFKYVVARIRLEDFLFKDQFDQARNAFGVGLSENILPVCFYGPFTDEEFFSDPHITELSVNELYYFYFAGRE